jgi:RIO kinase 1
MIDLEEFDDYEQTLTGQLPRKLKLNHKPKQPKHAIRTVLYEKDERGRDELEFAPSVTATDAEMAWIHEHLAQFFHSKFIKDVNRRVKGGKEANVYCCAGHSQSGHDWVAAKLYRSSQYRSLKNAAQYQQGRAILDGKGGVVGARDWRMLKAIAGKSRKGVVAAQTSWVMYEFTMLQKLYQAGADVPEPYKHGEYALLMEYIGDGSMPAPLLLDVELEETEARQILERLIWNLEILLQQGWVHGDFSAYNVLYWKGKGYIIDFPQVADVHTNPDAKAIFGRDVERTCQYFNRYGIQTDSRRLARDLWQKYVPRKQVYE